MPGDVLAGGCGAKRQALAQAAIKGQAFFNNYGSGGFVGGTKVQVSDKGACQARGGTWAQGQCLTYGASGAGSVGGQVAVKNKKQCQAQGGIWTAKGKICQILPVSGPGARLPAANKKQCSAQGGVWTAKGKVCQVPPQGSDVPGGAVPSTKPWFQPPVTKPGTDEVRACTKMQKICPSGTVYTDWTKGDGCNSACIDAGGNILGYGSLPETLYQPAPLPGSGGSEGGVDVGTIRPEDLLTEFKPGGSGGEAAPESWFDKPVFGSSRFAAPQFLFLAGLGGLLFWSLRKNRVQRAKWAVKRVSKKVSRGIRAYRRRR
jgi:hypothetical protein